MLRSSGEPHPRGNADFQRYPQNRI